MPFPFTDLSAAKDRPAVILTPDPMGPDIVVAYLSSVIPDGSLPETHVLVADDYQEFRDTGLKRTSVVRLDKLRTQLSNARRDSKESRAEAAEPALHEGPRKRSVAPSA